MVGVSHTPGVDLESRFARLTQRFGVAPHAGGIFPLLAEHYSEPGRHYHTLQHIHECLLRLDQVKDLPVDSDAVELALWFHDAVYDPTADDNELRSAFLFDRRLGIHLPTQRADNVHAMIMATVHDGDAGDGDARYVVDIDLLGFAAPWPDFLRDTELLRRECRHRTDVQFQLDTLGFFEKLLMRPSIYLTEHFRTNNEIQARQNIADCIARYRS